MNVFVRWGKFNLVGAAGMAVQLGVLALLNVLAPAHYLLTSAAALEITLVHNFAWHVRFTWRDRRDGSPFWGQFLRFHLANGFVSLFGNLAVMHLLVHTAHLHVLPANAIAILCCSIVNFCLGDGWTFAARA
ncbi:MAG TPA: GtrA family protein [Terracidiphilus sp.]|nr:GtrA family protein [Terracidiphilus sp.]